MEERERKIRITVGFPRSTYQQLQIVRERAGLHSVEETIHQAVEEYLRHGPPLEAHVEERITPRQRQVLHLIAEGKKTKEIARQLKISVKTVEMHRTQLMDALNLHNIAGLVRYAIRTGLIKA